MSTYRLPSMRPTPRRGHPADPETYLGTRPAINYGGRGAYDQGTATFDYPAQLPDDTFALPGQWTPGPPGRDGRDDGNAIALNYHAHNVYLAVGRLHVEAPRTYSSRTSRMAARPRWSSTR